MAQLGPNQIKWLEALESDAFAQGKHALHREGEGFCCLGVACDIFKNDAVEIETCADGLKYDGNWETAPGFVMSALALFTEEGTPQKGGSDLKLTELNDSGKTFRQIAKIVREAPDSYFKEAR